MAARGSRCERIAAAWLLLCAVVLAPELACAQGGPICASLQRTPVTVAAGDPREDVYLGSGNNWLTAELKKRYPPLPRPPEDAGAMRFQVQRIRLALGNSAALGASASATLLRTRLLEELAIIDAALARLDASKPVSLAKLKGMYGLARLDQSSRQETCAGTTYTSDSLFFEDGAPSEQIVLRVSPQATAGVPGLAIPVASAPISFFSIDEASEFRAALEALRALLNGPLLESVERTSLRLTRIHKSWSNYLERGFSQFPWEALLNSWRELRWDEAPKTQWVFVHPEAAMVIDLRSLDHASVAGALLVHGLGYIGYGGQTRSWFLGASATGAVTTSSAFGLGGGGTLHFGHTKVYAHVPHISVAGLLFATDRGGAAPFIDVSADLWRLVSDSGESIFQKRLPAK